MKNTVGGICRRFVSLGVAVAAPVIPSFALAAENEPHIRLDETVITPTRTSTALENVGSAVTVISREEIEKSQMREVVDLLRKVPGVSVVQSGRPGGQVSVFTRGLNSNQTLFLLDGARIGNPLNGLVTLSNLTADQVERIEVVRGPQSTLYGSDALGGVINIVTRKGDEMLKDGKSLGGSATLEGGSYDGFRQAIDLWGGSRRLSGTLSFSHVSTKNPYENDQYENTTVGGSVTFRPTDELQLSGTFRYTNGRNGLPGAVSVAPPNLTEHLLDENFFGRIALDWTLYEIWQQTLSISDTHEEMFDRGNAFSESDSRSDAFQIGWQNNVKLGKTNTLTAGIDWYLNKGQYETVGATPFEKTVRNTAVYLQDQALLFKRLSLTGGIRYDDNSRFGSEFTYQGTGVLRFDETHTRLKGSVGTGFKAPTLNDLYLTFPDSGFGAFLANPNLKPERSLGWDIGFEQDLCKHATLSMRYFQNNVRDLITSSSVGADMTQTNVDRARTAGIEATLNVHPTQDLTLSFGYTWLAEAKDLASGSRLLRRPEHTGNIAVNYHFLDRFNLNTNLSLVGARADIDAATFAPTSDRPYAKWDVALSVEVHKNLEIFGRVENLLDERYEEANGYPSLGRIFWAGMKLKF
jgi:vitamin B12 transporter